MKATRRTKAGKGDKKTFDRILVAVDDSPQSTWAVQLASGFAEVPGASLALIHVYPQPPYLPDLLRTNDELDIAAQREGKAILERQSGDLPVGFKAETILRDGQAAAEILKYAQMWNPDLIVLGTHGRGRLTGVFLGGTAEAVVREAQCPVLTVAHDPSRSRSHKPVDVASSPSAVKTAVEATAHAK